MNRRPVDILGASALAFLLALAAASTPAQQTPPPAPGQPAASGEPPKPRPVRKDRVFVRDVEGLWITRDYVEALRATRQPLEAARKASPVVVKIQKESRGYAIVRTDFNQAVLMKVVDIEPEGKAGAFRIAAAASDGGAISASEVTYISVRGRKNDQGRFDSLSMAEPTFSKKRFREYVRADEGLASLVNAATVAGAYVDQDKRNVVFTRGGEATLGTDKFPYEVSLVTKGVACNLIESTSEAADAPRRRIGFAWKAGKLHLFDATDSGGSIKCGSKPIAVLERQGDAPADGGGKV